MGGKARLRVECKPGDVLLINTRMWWHQTNIECTKAANCKLSLSCARDFYLGKQDAACDMTNVDGLYSAQPFKRGEVVVWESDIQIVQSPGVTIQIVRCRMILGKEHWWRCELCLQGSG